VSGESFLSRWSRRKSASEAGAAGPTADAVPAQAGTQSDEARVAGPTADPVPAQAGTQSDASTSPAAVSASSQSVEPASPRPLPPVESLTPESDFAAFMRPGVDPSLKRQAFKKLIEDPRYNVMDGLDVYIDDYSKADPLPEGWLEKMNQVRYLGIFKEDAEKGDAATGSPELAQAPQGAEQLAEPEALPEAMQDAPVSFPPRLVPADTSGEEKPAAEVGKSVGMKGGS
jgi:hypothetical protein